MKRALILFLILCFCLPFSACSSVKEETIVLFPSAGRSLPGDAGAVFTSSDESVVSVDDSGLAIALAPGKASVTVKNKKSQRVYHFIVEDPAKYISLYDCSKITLQNEDVLQKVQEVIDSLLLENATWTASGKNAEKGDRLTIDYTATVDKTAVSALSSSGEVFILGSGNFVQGFENALVGSKKGDNIRLDLTLPADYADIPALAGKPVTFDVLIKKVEHPNYPEFDNEFVKEHTKYDNINDFDKQEYINAKASLAIAAMVEKSTLKNDPPEELYDHYFDQYVKRLETVLYYEYQKQVSGLPEILKLLNLTEQQLRDSAQSQLAASVMQDCVFHAFMYQNNLTLSEEEFAKGTALYVSENGYESLEDMLATSGLSLADIREVVLIDFIALKAADMVSVKK